MNNYQKRSKVLRIANSLNDGGEFSIIVDRRVYVCKNNGQFTYSHKNLPGWATFVGSFTFDGFIRWHEKNCGK